MYQTISAIMWSEREVYKIVYTLRSQPFLKIALTKLEDIVLMYD